MRFRPASHGGVRQCCNAADMERHLLELKNLSAGAIALTAQHWSDSTRRANGLRLLGIVDGASGRVV